MKAYIPNQEYEFIYPDEMKKIMDYLESHGKVMVSPHTIEKLYCEWSDDEWCAGWIHADEETTIPQFAEWLSKYDI